MAAKMLSRKWRIFVIIIAGILLILGLAFLSINSYLTKKLSAELKSTVLKASDGLYRIDFSHAEIHLLQGKAVLYDIKLIPDTILYDKMRLQGHVPAELIELQVKKLLITNAHPFKLYFHKQLDVGQVTLDGPVVQVSKYTVKPDSGTKKDTTTLYQKISKSLKFIRVGTIGLNQVSLTYKDLTGPKPQVFVLKELNLNATDLLIDSATQKDTGRTLFCRDVVTGLHHFKWVTADGLYVFKVKSVQLSTLSARLAIAGIVMAPTTPNIFFAASKKWDRYNLHLDSVILNHFDFRNFRPMQELTVAHMIIKKGSFEVYTNPNGKPKKTDRIVTYPNWVLRHLKTKLDIDTLDLKHIDIVYRQYNKSSMHEGAVDFSNTSARLLNVTNKKAIISRHPYGTVKLTTYLMGKGKLDADFNFNLSDAGYDYNYTGHLGPVDLQTGNPALIPLGMVKVTSGAEKSLDFSIHATRTTATGKVTFLYNDLKVAILRHDAQGDYSKKSLLSFLANAIVLKNNNPDNDHSAPRFAEVTYTRPANVAFFGSIWQTILSGIKPCAGLGKSQK